MTVPKFEGDGIIRFHEKDVPVPGAGLLLLQVGANALCGSERGQFYDGSKVTPGHEGAGLVAAAGAETTTPVGTTGAVFLMEINGAEGRIAIDDTVKRYTFHRRGEETGKVWEAGYFNDFEREFLRIFDRYLAPMLEAFKRDEEPPVHARAGYRALALAQAAIESHETGRRVSVADAVYPSR
ncbi:MAG: Gfo/Idh/MocA family oxidoreductase [Chloroflexi bacterium]|nr:Gfo/Idh/MocA family oxidoreductase [Chloroflexota bacterium]